MKTRLVRCTVVVLTAAVWLLLPSTGAAQTDLDKAYQREFAFLEAERNALQARLKQLETESVQKLEAARAEVDSLQGAVLGLSLQADQATELLSDVEREVDSVAEGDDVLETLLTQVATTLERGALSFPEADKDNPDARVEQLRFAFGRAVPLLRQFGSVYETKDSFFTASGDKADGTVIHLGQVASFGVSDKAAGALAPAGNAQLKIWPDVASAGVARALLAREKPASLSLFLYESLDKGMEQQKAKTVVELIDSGGVIGWVIVAGGVVALSMALLRALLLFVSATNTSRLVEKITPLVAKKQFDEAIRICRGAKSAGGRVLTATLQNLHRDRPGLEDIVTEAILHERPTLDRFGSSIIVIAAVSPLLGLLGTVTGMIATFDIITEFGTGNPKLLSSGISIALVTTELGLIVAIPALILGNMLSSWADGIKDGLDKAALRVTNIATGVRLSERPDKPVTDEQAFQAVIAT